MTSLLLLCLMGDCRACVVQRQVVYPVKSYVAPVVSYAAVQYPVVLYSAGDTQKIEALTKIAEQNAVLLQQQQQMLQALSAGPQAQTVSATESAARAIMQRSCVKCHSGDNPKGELDLTGPLTIAQKLLIVDMAENEEMPPKPGKALPDEEFQALRKWALEDRAAVREFLKAK